MMGKLVQHSFSYGLILIWVIFWLLGRSNDLTELLAGKGLDQIGHQYYRFGSALLLHKNLFHLLGNVLALYWIGAYLEPQISSVKLWLFTFALAVLAQFIFLTIYRNAVSIGGSPVIFVLIGLIVILNIMNKAELKFKLETWYGNWILIYAVLSNFPILGNDRSILVIHGISLLLGLLFGGIAIGFRFF